MPKIEDTLNKNASRFKPKKFRAWDMEAAAPDRKETVSSNDDSSAIPQLGSQDHQVVEISPEKITNWKFSDRPESELGDIAALSQDLQSVGQQQPCIVRKANIEGYEYELIVGERRWRAARKIGIKLKAIIKDLDDSSAALAQISENSNRKDLSDYAKGMNYAKLIEEGIVSQSDLITKLGISKQQVSRLLSFKDIPTEVMGSIKDTSKVSCYTAEKIKQLCSKGDDYINAIISLGDKIGSGHIAGHKSLSSAVDKIINASSPVRTSNTKVFTKDGRHVFTWRKDNNKNPSIHFPKQILTLFDSNKLSADELTNEIVEIIEHKLKNIH